MQDDRSPWLDDEDLEADGRTGRRRLRLLAAAATLPWLVVGAVVLAPGWRDRPPAPPDPTHAPHAEHGDQAAVPDATAAPPPHTDPLLDPEAVLGLTELRGDWRIGPEPGDLAAIAAIVARAWLTGVDPVLTISGIEPLESHYVEHLVVEAVERPTADTAVATLSAIVLEDDGEGFVARIRRLGVPLLVGADGARPAGPPWFLPVPDLRPAALDTVTVDDPAVLLAAAEAVTAAGYLEAELHALAHTDGGAWIARVSARTPDGAAVDGPVWLRRHLDGFVVAGTPLPSSRMDGGLEDGR